MMISIWRRKMPPGKLLVATILTAAASASMAGDWPMFGQSPANTASSTELPNLSIGNVSKLTPLWTFTTGGDVSARAAVVLGIAYFPDWAGNIYAVDAFTGALIWKRQLSDYGLAAGTYSRTSPAVVDGIVYIGTQYVASGPTGWLLAIDRFTGKLIWKTQPDPDNPSPVITASPVVVEGTVYVGMTSNEEFVAGESSTYICCSQRGSVVAVDAFNGAVKWQTHTVPLGYSGGNVWGSTPVVDAARRTVYVGTGNNYAVPNDPSYQACISMGLSRASCLPADDHFDSVIAFDTENGAIKWATRLASWNQPNAADPAQSGVTNGSDFWNTSCGGMFGYAGNCPPSPGPDYDFGSGPNEITYDTGRRTETIIGVGQKSGIYYALNPDTGAVLWKTQVGPGSSLGGIEWGSASDGTSIYVAIANLDGLPYGVDGSLTAGSWAALDPATGAIKWQTADPTPYTGAIDLGPLAVANGVVYAPSMGGYGSASTVNPTMFALNAETGKIVWSFAPGSSVIAGATIAEDTVFWGAGYSHFGPTLGSGNNKFFAFSTRRY
jgi:polyvinyl alcohol dehydrogenase (cytochrome)